MFNTSLVIWLSLFPLTYLVHIGEEYWCGGGYSNYLLTQYRVKLSAKRFLALQTLGVFLMVLGVVLAIGLRFPFTMIALLSVVVIGNAFVHAVRSIHKRAYAPGLITATALWLPLGVVSLAAVWSNISPAKLVIALTAGLVSNLVVEMISFSNAERQDQSDAKQ